jgi:hypothetical protein
MSPGMMKDIPRWNSGFCPWSLRAAMHTWPHRSSENTGRSPTASLEISGSGHETIRALRFLPRQVASLPDQAFGPHFAPLPIPDSRKIHTGSIVKHHHTCPFPWLFHLGVVGSELGKELLPLLWPTYCGKEKNTVRTRFCPSSQNSLVSPSPSLLRGSASSSLSSTPVATGSSSLSPTSRASSFPPYSTRRPPAHLPAVTQQNALAPNQRTHRTDHCTGPGPQEPPQDPLPLSHHHEHP